MDWKNIKSVEEILTERTGIDCRLQVARFVRSLRAQSNALADILTQALLVATGVTLALRSRQAHHEAGHALIAINEGLGLRHITIGKQPEYWTNYQLNRCTGSTAAAQVKFYLAGFAADRHYAPMIAARENPENEFDFAQALRLVDLDYLERLLRECERTVIARWAQVTAVAQALLQHKRLEALEIYKIIVKVRWT